MYLPSLCIHLILIHLKVDIKTLHSCLLVDRLWCSETVRILWRQPFRHLYISIFLTEKSSSRAENLILTYLSCIFYQYNEELMKHSVIPKPVKNPMFNYVQFLKNLDLLEFLVVIQYCADTLTLEDYRPAISYILLDNPLSKPVRTLADGQIDNDLLNIMIKIITDHSTGLYRLLLDAEEIIKDNLIINTHNHRIMKIVNSKGLLSQLTELIMPTRTFSKTKILLALIPVSRNLKKIVVRVGYKYQFLNILNRRRYVIKQEVKALADLIKAQENLEHLGLLNCTEELDCLLMSIESQADTLKYLSFEKVHFHGFDMFKHIATLRNLEQIRFIYCTFKLKDDYRPYRFENNFPKLVKLEIYESINAGYAVDILRSAACGSLNVESEPRNSIFALEY